MKSNPRLKYKSLASALKSENCGNRTHYMHYESKMYAWERVDDIQQPFRDWKYNLENGQKVIQYFNIHKDNSTPILRTHLVYEAKDSHVLSVFSCNLSNFGTLDLQGLNIEESQKGLEKLPYLQSKVEAGNNKSTLEELLIK